MIAACIWPSEPMVKVIVLPLEVVRVWTPATPPGAYEAALAGHALHDPAQPIEILRTIHSFDPCIACAVHVLDLQEQ